MASLIFFYGMGYQGREQPDPKPRGEIAHGFGALPGRLPAIEVAVDGVVGVATNIGGPHDVLRWFDHKVSSMAGSCQSCRFGNGVRSIIAGKDQ